jgi:hypothetical protein
MRQGKRVIARIGITIVVIFLSSGIAVADLFSPSTWFSRQQPDELDSVLHNEYARVYAFYQRMGMFPVFKPATETPGDVYQDVLGNGRFVAFRRDCFPGLTPVRSGSSLPNIKDTLATELDGDAKAAIEDAKLVGGQFSLKFSDKRDLTFQNVAVAIATPPALLKAFKPNNAGCDRVAQILYPEKSIQGQQPTGLILGTVWSAIMESHLVVRAEGSAKAEATADELLKLIDELSKRLIKRGLPVKLELSGNIGGKGEAAREVTIANTRVLPVGWQPAFISADDLKTILTLLKQDRINIMKKTFIYERKKSPTKPNQQIRETISKEAGFALPRPTEIATRAATGPFVEYDAENPEHVGYVAAVDTLLALSYELDTEPPRR